MKKRETFAVQLRKEKKKEILETKRRLMTGRVFARTQIQTVNVATLAMTSKADLDLVVSQFDLDLVSKDQVA